MNIVHLGVGGSIAVPPGDVAAGTERYIFNLTDHLGQLGCNVTVIDIKGGQQQKDGREKSAAKYQTVWHPNLPHSLRMPFRGRFFDYLLLMTHLAFFTVPAICALNRQLKQKKVDVIHFHSSLSALAGILLNKLWGYRAITVYTMHTGFSLTKMGWRKKLPALPEIIAMRWADHIIAPSPAVKRWLVSELKLPESKITQIYTSADIAEAGNFIANKTGTSRKTNMVLDVGSISTRKNQLSAVKTVSKVAAEFPDVRFVFAGMTAEADYYESIQRYIAENNLKQWVEFTGEVSRAKLFNLFNEATLFLFPTTAEAQGLVVAEAMAFGLPVVSSNIEPIADMVNTVEGSTIMVGPYDIPGMTDAVVKLLRDGSLRQAMSEKGKKLANRFSHRHVAEEMLALYKHLIQSKIGVVENTPST
jgi:glycosyltransferase involved in cell wall biosynthesis